MQNQTYQSDYIPGVWFTTHHRSDRTYPRRRKPTQEKRKHIEKGNQVSKWIVLAVVLTGVLTAGILVLVVYLATSGDNNKGTVTTTTPVNDRSAIEGYDLEVYNNPLDYRAFKTVTENGTVTVYGQKDADGILTLAEAIEYIDQNEKKNMVDLDENGLIQSVRNDDASIQFFWSIATDSLVAIVLKADGSLQANVNIQLNNVDLSNLTSSSSRRKRSASSSKQSVVKRQTMNYVRIPVSVSDCYAPADGATVYGSAIFNYDASNPGVAIQCKGQPTSQTGEYELLLPTETVSDAPEMVENICSGISEKVGICCNAVTVIDAQAESQICSQIGSAIEGLTLAVPGDSALVLETCEAGFNALRSTCSAFDALVDEPGLFDDACSSVERAVDLASNLGQNIFLQPYARLADGQILASAAMVMQTPPSSAAMPTGFDITEDGTSFKVLSLQAVPNDPGALEDYNVEIYYNCVTQGTVFMEIVGSDNYRRNQTCTAVNDRFGCFLYVQGGEAHVSDHVTVTYMDDTGQTLYSRELVLVF